VFEDLDWVFRDYKKPVVRVLEKENTMSRAALHRRGSVPEFYGEEERDAKSLS
jgi:hypothetical protein